MAAARTAHRCVAAAVRLRVRPLVLRLTTDDAQGPLLRWSNGRIAAVGAGAAVDANTNTGLVLWAGATAVAAAWFGLGAQADADADWPLLTMADVASHCSPEDCWLAIGGYV